MADESCRSERRKLVAVAICALSTFLVNIDNTAYQVAVPTITKEFAAAAGVAGWILGSFTLALAATELYMGWGGDRFGRRRLLGWGLGVYILGSIITALSASVEMLIVARVIAGLGAAALVPMGLAIVRMLAATEDELQRFTSLWGIAVGVGMAMGPLIGGLFTQYITWRALSASAVFVAGGFLLASQVLLPQSRERDLGVRYDWFGITSLTACTTLITVAILLNASGLGTGSLVCMLAAILIAIALVIRFRLCGRDPFPMPQQRGALFVPALAVAAANYLGLGGGITIISIGVLQQGAGISAGETGLLLLPLALGYALGSRAATRVISRWSVGSAMVIAGAIGLLTVLFAGIVVSPSNLAIAIPIVGFFLGLSVGGANTPTNSLAMSQMPKTGSGMAGAFASTARQVGQGLGIALAGVSIAIVTAHRFPAGLMWVPIALAFGLVSAIGLWVKARPGCGT